MLLMKNLCTILLLVWACAPLKGYSPKPKALINPDSLQLLIANPNLHASLIEEIAKSLENQQQPYTPLQRLQLLTQLSFMQNYLGDNGNAQATLTKASAWSGCGQNIGGREDFLPKKSIIFLTKKSLVKTGYSLLPAGKSSTIVAVFQTIASTGCSGSLSLSRNLRFPLHGHLLL